jgi:hypothetical protein
MVSARTGRDIGSGGARKGRAPPAGERSGTITREWERKEQILPARAVTRGPKQHYFGYYDKQQFAPTGRYLLGHECSFIGRMQREQDVAVVGLTDLEAGDHWTPLAETRAFNWQMGSMLEWLPGSRDRIIHNDRREGTFVSVIRDLDGRELRVLPRAIFALAPDGRSGLSLNFARLWDVRPETGYCGVADPWIDQPAPADDGIFRVDLQTGQAHLIVSHEVMAAFRPRGGSGRTHWYFTHPEFNADGTRFAFWYRSTEPAGSSLFSAAADGGNLCRLTHDGTNSHTVWQGRHRLLSWVYGGPDGTHFYQLTDCTDEREVFGAGVLTCNGHAVFSPDGNWLLTDRPPDEQAHEQVLALCNLRARVCYEVGRFAAMRELYHPHALRCDLHARWNRQGTAVCFDSTQDGSRQMYVMDVRQLVRGG